MSDSAAQRLLAKGQKWYARGCIEEALDLFDAAQIAASATGEHDVEADAWTHIGRVSSLSCEPKVAEHAFGEAGACFARAGDAAAVQAAKVRQAFMAYDAGDRDRALALLDEISAAKDASPKVIAMAEGYRANVARSRGDYVDAERGHVAAIARLDAIDERLYASTFRMDLAITKLLAGDAGQALRELERARSWEPELEEPMLSALLAHYQAVAFASLDEHALAAEIIERFEAPASVAMDFLRASHGWLRELAGAAGESRSALRDRLALLQAQCPPYEHGRLTMRIFWRLAGGDGASADLLLVDESTCSARIGPELDVRFVADSPEWRVFVALVDAHDRPERASVPASRLVEAGWPGERMLEKAAKNRLHVALSNLRKRGLREVLLRHHDGYALSRALVIVRGPIPRRPAQSESA